MRFHIAESKGAWTLASCNKIPFEFPLCVYFIISQQTRSYLLFIFNLFATSLADWSFVCLFVFVVLQMGDKRKWKTTRKCVWVRLFVIQGSDFEIHFAKLQERNWKSKIRPTLISCAIFYKVDKSGYNSALRSIVGITTREFCEISMTENKREKRRKKIHFSHQGYYE